MNNVQMSLVNDLIKINVRNYEVSVSVVCKGIRVFDNVNDAVEYAVSMIAYATNCAFIECMDEYNSNVMPPKPLV